MRTIAAGITDTDFVEEFDSLLPFTVQGPILIITKSGGTGTITIDAELYLNGVVVETLTGKVNAADANGRYFKLGPRSPNEGANNALTSFASTPEIPELFSTKRLKIRLRVTANTMSASTDILVHVTGHKCKSGHIIREFIEFVAESGVVSSNSGHIGVERTVKSVSGPGKLFGIVSGGFYINFGGSSGHYLFYADSIQIDSTSSAGANGAPSLTAIGFGFRSITFPENVLGGNYSSQPTLAQGPNIQFETELKVTCVLDSSGAGPTTSFFTEFYYGKLAAS